ncbi:hypothetical protein AOLI_G00306010 [Acnodon oligacanthus]
MRVLSPWMAGSLHLICSSTLILTASFPAKRGSHVEQALSPMSDSKCASVQLMNEEDVGQRAWLMGGQEEAVYGYRTVRRKKMSLGDELGVLASFTSTGTIHLLLSIAGCSKLGTSELEQSEK